MVASSGFVAGSSSGGAGPWAGGGSARAGVRLGAGRPAGRSSPAAPGCPVRPPLPLLLPLPPRGWDPASARCSARRPAHRWTTTVTGTSGSMTSLSSTRSHSPSVRAGRRTGAANPAASTASTAAASTLYHSSCHSGAWTPPRSAARLLGLGVVLVDQVAEGLAILGVEPAVLHQVRQQGGPRAAAELLGHRLEPAADQFLAGDGGREQVDGAAAVAGDALLVFEPPAASARWRTATFWPPCTAPR